MAVWAGFIAKLKPVVYKLNFRVLYRLHQLLVQYYTAQLMGTIQLGLEDLLRRKGTEELHGGS